MLQILDTHNLYHTTRAKYGENFKVDYAKIYKHRSIAIIPAESGGFENYLRQVGYEVVKVDNPDEQGVMAMLTQLLRITDEYVILGTQDIRILPIVEVLKGRGTYVEIFGVGIVRDLRMSSNRWTEVAEVHLCTTV